MTDEEQQSRSEKVKLPDVSIARLPVVDSQIYGRRADTAWLDACWAEGANVASIIAFGGVGKSALVWDWLRGMQRADWCGAERIYGWSFYSQGTTDLMTSAGEFISAALRWFGEEPNAGSPWDKGQRLAGLIRRERVLLVLDGVEPLQWGPGPNEGSIKDPALATLVRELGAQNVGLCVITSRLPVREAEELPEKCRRLDLSTLTEGAGAQFLRARGVKGTEEELREAAREYGGHGLALALLASYLEEVGEGDVQRRREVGPLVEDERLGGHARRVIAAYERMFGSGSVEVALLRMLGLFDRPAGEREIATLRAHPPIAGLTVVLAGIREHKWNKAVARLRRMGLLAASNGQDNRLDAHPLVREHFMMQLQQAYPEAYREGHRRLYEHLLRTARTLPDTVEEMEPLYTAVVHGCKAGKSQEALDEVWWKRIQREDEYLNTKKLGAFVNEVRVLAAFFDPPWQRLAPGLCERDQITVLNNAGFTLRALGRTPEALELMRMALDKNITQKNWSEAANSASNLSELLQARGELTEALALARKGVEFADKSGNALRRMYEKTTLATALHAMGLRGDAAVHFEDAKRIQKDMRSPPVVLSSWNGGAEDPAIIARFDRTEQGSKKTAFVVLSSVKGGVGRSTILSTLARTVATRSPLVNLDRDDDMQPLLYALQGFRYCDLLLDFGRDVDVSEHVAQTLRIGRSRYPLLDIALDHLSLGRAAILYAEREASEDFTEAASHLDRAVDGLRRAGYQENIPRGLLVRAALHTRTRAFDLARQDLDEAERIASRCGYRLHQTDAYLGYASLALAERVPAAAFDHLATARKIIEATGYHRRDKELVALEAEARAMAKTVLPPPPQDVEERGVDQPGARRELDDGDRQLVDRRAPRDAVLERVEVGIYPGHELRGRKYRAEEARQRRAGIDRRHHPDCRGPRRADASVPLRCTMSSMTDTVRVLVSYAQDTEAHKDRCRKLADRLRADGVDAWIDQYVPAPPEGWPRWMQQQIAAAKFVLLVCTPTFRRRFEGTETPGVGKGATWEGLISTQVLYDSGARNEKFVPVLFEDATEQAVPDVMRPFTRYALWDGFDALLRHLTDQPAVVVPPVGARRVMPPVTSRAPPASHDSAVVPATISPPARATPPMTPGAEAVLQARDQVHALYELLALLFDANELRIWLRFNAEGEAIVRALPGDSVSKAELVFKATDLLHRRNLVDEEFFDRLRDHQPRQAAVIDHVRARWVVA